MTKFCIKCGRENTDDAIFCSDCGYNFLNNSINDFQNNETKKSETNNFGTNSNRNKKIVLVVTCVCLLLLGFLVFAQQHASIVVGDSMEPAIHDGDIILCEKTNFLGIQEFDPNELVAGDIITYNSPSFQKIIIGRITKVDYEGGMKSYWVKGDKYEGGESVYPSQIISKVMKNGNKPIVI